MKHQLELILTGDERSRKFEEYADSLVRRYPGIDIHRKTEGDSDNPALVISPNIRLEAVPSNKWEGVFIDFLIGDGSFSNAAESVEKLNVPAQLKLFIAPFCPFCTHVISAVLPLVSNQTFLQLTIIDGEMFPEKASADQVRAAPTLILDNMVRWTGTIDMAEVVSIIRDRDPASLGADSLRTLLENGAAEELARMMAGSGKIFPAFLDLLTHQKWPLRLGAMVAFEYLLEQDRALADEVVESLWLRFDKLDNSVKGDVLLLFGQSGGEAIIDYLKTILNGAYSRDVLDAAEEALESILSKEL